MSDSSKNIWKYNNKIILIIDGLGKNRGLHIRPKKLVNNSTRQITLEVAIEKGEALIASVEIGLLDLTKGLMSLREYGLLLQIYEAMAIKTEIENNFDDIDEVEIGDWDDWSNDDTDFDGILKLFANYFIENKTEPEDKGVGEKLYLISIDEFNKLVKNSVYNKIKISKIRNRLTQGYIHYNLGGDTYQVRVTRDDGTSVTAKRIAFKESVINPLIEIIKTEKENTAK